MPEIKVHLREGGYLVFDDHRGRWRAEGGARAQAAEFANEESRHYEWSPADGQPGHRLARDIARQMGGRAELPPVPPLPPGAVS